MSDEHGHSYCTLQKRVEELENYKKQMLERVCEVVDRSFFTYTAKNGKQVSVEDDNGEKVWLVPSDAIHELEACARQALQENEDG